MNSWLDMQQRFALNWLNHISCYFWTVNANERKLFFSRKRLDFCLESHLLQEVLVLKTISAPWNSNIKINFFQRKILIRDGHYTYLTSKRRSKTEQFSPSKASSLLTFRYRSRRSFGNCNIYFSTSFPKHKFVATTKTHLCNRITV